MVRKQAKKRTALEVIHKVMEQKELHIHMQYSKGRDEKYALVHLVFRYSNLCDNSERCAKLKLERKPI